MLSQMYTKQEVELLRNPTEYIEWFEKLLNKVNSDKSTKKESLTHSGSFKIFYEEIFPLWSLLKQKKDEWTDSSFRNIF